jgi:hypothetical protein
MLQEIAHRASTWLQSAHLIVVLLQEITPRIYMADSDFDAITNNGAICDKQAPAHARSTDTMASRPPHIHTPALPHHGHVPD